MPTYLSPNPQFLVCVMHGWESLSLEITHIVSVCVLRSRLRMWLQSLPRCGALIKCGCGVTPCLRCPDCGSTASSPFFWQCRSHWQQGSSSLYSAAFTSGRTVVTLGWDRLIGMGELINAFLVNKDHLVGRWWQMVTLPSPFYSVFPQVETLFRSVERCLCFISEMSSCFVHTVSLQVNHALCAAASHQHALGSDCVGQHTEHSHQPLLYQYWKVLRSNHHPPGKRWRQIKKKKKHTVCKCLVKT